MPAYYELEVSLKEIRPRIWRRFLLPATATFADLHEAIQDSFGWGNYHLWEFRKPGRRGSAIAGVPDEEAFAEERVPDAHTVKLSRFFKGPSEACQYTYDFGDDWLHDVKLVRKVEEPASFRRRLVAGRRACPPEDSGGAGGYFRCVQFLESGKDPYGESAAELREWIGGWRPDQFDLGLVKRKFDG